MGIGFVIIIHLIGLAIVSFVIALLSTALTFILSKKESRTKKIVFASLWPFVGLFTLYFAGLFGSIVVSGIKDIDIGIGDSWYVPLGGHCDLLFIDLPEQAYVECNGQTLVSEVSTVQHVDNYVSGSTADGKYFLINTLNDDLQTFPTEQDFKSSVTGELSNLKNAWEFYNERRSEIAGTSLIIVGILSVLISAFSVFVLRRILYGRIFGKIFGKTTANSAKPPAGEAGIP